MSHVRFIVLTATAAVFLAAGSPMLFAQGLITQKALPLEMAQAIAQGAVDRCRADGFHVSVTVIDGSGLLKVFMRDEGTGPHTIDLSRRKAYTALTFASPSAQFAQQVAKDPGAAQRATLPGIIGIAGGLPIKLGEDTIGGVGISGSPGGNDEPCSKAGIDRIAAQLR